MPTQSTPEEVTLTATEILNGGGRTSPEAEIKALAALQKKLAELDPAARKRALTWLNATFAE
jgi:hypothetical protein